MKKAFKLKAGLAALFAAVLVFALWAGFSIPPVSASAETYGGAYDYTFAVFRYEAEISDDRVD